MDKWQIELSFIKIKYCIWEKGYCKSSFPFIDVNSIYEKEIWRFLYFSNNMKISRNWPLLPYIYLNKKSVARLISHSELQGTRQTCTSFYPALFEDWKFATHICVLHWFVHEKEGGGYIIHNICFGNFKSIQCNHSL